MLGFISASSPVFSHSVSTTFGSSFATCSPAGVMPLEAHASTLWPLASWGNAERRQKLLVAYCCRVPSNSGCQKFATCPTLRCERTFSTSLVLTAGNAVGAGITTRIHPRQPPDAKSERTRSKIMKPHMPVLLQYILESFSALNKQVGGKKKDFKRFVFSSASG